ncbi:mechanosensitive ion channel family protein [Polymorphobacter sp. PAMC 29334]|uniref:mechanosensitive ion channel family protein n=1 Tax=Polymorphobacter sp. PAMC 29334 TaxID=2862331 RepID=UPI001C6788D8|nr:mechanosensitive ion channel family protein [Polymorphobacter sp. PAMC 29334]QYE34483.1 mechanosensitive ion channel family protein [Polymorphobacter sp. PAMC 29334]
MRAPIDLITAKVNSFVAEFFLLLPNMVAAIVFLAIAWFVSRLVKSAIARVAATRGRNDLGNLLGSLAKGGIQIIAVLFAAAIVFPSVNPGGVFATLGVGSVAIGFAFKDILQNLLAGLLLLVNRPYRRGDQIVVKGFEGTVEHIESRATLIKTYDGRRVIIPNSDVYTSPVVVNTAFPHRRDEYLIGIGYGDDPEATAATFVAAIAAVEGVLADPAPDALVWELAESTVNIKARWWVSSKRTDVVHARARVILAIHKTATAHGIDLPFPTTVVLLHDQSEETDGDRTKQREGWPAGTNPPKPRRRILPAGDAATDRSADAPDPRSRP